MICKLLALLTLAITVSGSSVTPCSSEMLIVSDQYFECLMKDTLHLSILTSSFPNSRTVYMNNFLSSFQTISVEVRSLDKGHVMEFYLNEKEMCSQGALITNIPGLNWFRPKTGSDRWTSYCALTFPVLTFTNSPQEFTIRTHQPLHGGSVAIYIRKEFDTRTVSMLILALVLTMYGAWFVDLPVVRWLLCISIGSVVILGFILYYVGKDFSRSTLGKVGIFGAVSFGSISLLTDGVMSTLAHFVLLQLRTDVYFQAGSSAAGLFLGIIIHYFGLDVYFIRFVKVMLYCAELCLILGGLWMNTACAGILLSLWFGIVVTFYGTSAVWNWITMEGYGSARDTFPPEVYQEAFGTRHPVCQGFRGSVSEKFAQYDKEGDIVTRRELEALSRYIRENPHELANINQPNSVARWAGIN
eukprot:PhF_6_TR15627/c0_g2_i3/m.24254